MAYTGTYTLPTIGGRTFSSARFNDQKVGEEFLKAAKLSGGATPFGALQGLSAGQYFTGEGGTEYRTVAGIDPNQPGWGTRVPTGYELIGYQQGSTGERAGGRRAYGKQFDVPGFAVLKKIGQPKVEEPVAGVIEEEEKKTEDLPKLDVGKTEEAAQPTMADVADMLKSSIGDLTKSFTDILTQQSEDFKTLQQSQTDRMEALQRAMIESQVQMRDRPQVAGVKMATGAAGTPMQIARRGVTGAFGRRGMRISSLNV